MFLLENRHFLSQAACAWFLILVSDGVNFTDWKTFWFLDSGLWSFESGWIRCVSSWRWRRCLRALRSKTWALWLTISMELWNWNSGIFLLIIVWGVWVISSIWSPGPRCSRYLFVSTGWIMSLNLDLLLRLLVIAITSEAISLLSLFSDTSIWGVCESLWFTNCSWYLMYVSSLC